MSNYLIKTFLAVTIAMLGISPHSFAANVTVVHGIDGRDLSLSKDLPVDISVNGNCAFTNVKYQQSAKATLPTGNYSIAVHPSDGSCKQTALFSGTARITNRIRSAAIVANLSAQGAPELSVINTTVRTKDSSSTACTSFVHAAFAPKVFIESRTNGSIAGTFSTNASYSNSNLLFGPCAATRSTIRTRFTVRATRTSTPIVRFSSSARAGSSVVDIIVGSTKNGLSLVRVTGTVVRP